MAATVPSTGFQDECSALVDELDLSEQQKRFMRARWLNETVWLDGKATQSQQRYYLLRLVAIVGGLTVPALVSLNVQSDAAAAITWMTFALSLIVATAVAVEGFFRYGERWRHYRRTCELMKSQGWQFFELAGAYARYRSHKAAFRAFATAVEGLIAEDVDVYIRQVMREKGSDEEPEQEA